MSYAVSILKIYHNTGFRTGLDAEQTKAYGIPAQPWRIDYGMGLYPKVIHLALHVL